MVPSTIHARLAAAPLLALTLGSAALAQTSTAWSFRYFEAANLTNSPVDLVAAGTDGVALLALTHATAQPNGTATALLGRFSGSGEHLWTWQGDGSPIAVDRDAAGNFFVLHHPSAAPAQLTSLDPDGGLRWSTTVDGPPHTAGGYFPLCLDVLPSGEARVGGSGWNGSLYPGSVVHAVDPNGQLLWSWDASGGSNAPIALGWPFRIFVDPQGQSFVFGQKDFCCGGTTWMLQVLDPNGQLLRSLPGTSSSSFSARCGDVGPAGDVAVAYSGATYPFGQPPQPGMDLRIQTGGAEIVVDLLPFVTTPASLDEGVQDLRFAPSGEIVLGLGDPTSIARFDVTGSLLSQWTLPASIHRIDRLTPMEDGGVVALCETTGGTFELLRLDAAGTITWTVAIDGDPEFLTARAGMAAIPLDGRGNGFVATTVDHPTDPNGSHALLTKWIDGGAIGTPYCGPANANSTGVGATIQAYGNPVAQTNNVTLISSDLPPSTSVLLLTSTDAGLVPGPGGSAGDLCLGGAVGRFVLPGEIRRASPEGTVALQVDLLALPQGLGSVPAVAGETWRFQSWYRDLVGGTQSSNFTDAVAVTLQ